MLPHLLPDELVDLIVQVPDPAGCAKFATQHKTTQHLADDNTVLFTAPYTTDHNCLEAVSGAAVDWHAGRGA
jgi:hypothetical protein